MANLSLLVWMQAYRSEFIKGSPFNIFPPIHREYRFTQNFFSRYARGEMWEKLENYTHNM